MNFQLEVITEDAMHNSNGMPTCVTRDKKNIDVLNLFMVFFYG